MNKIIFNGNLGKDAELTMAKNTGKAILKFSVAVAKGYKKEDGTNWFNCVMFGDRAEKLAQYLTKGTKVIIEGSVQLGNYEKDGVKHYTTDVFVNNVEMLGGSKEPSDEQKSRGSEYTSNPDVEPINDQDIPFK